MAYDVFLVAAIEDKDAAMLLARKLRALKFKVRYDKDREDETFDGKDARDASQATSMLVVWSQAALISDFVRAAASVGHSKPGTLVQASLDATKPYAPFNADTRHSLAGFTARKPVEGWYRIIDDLSERQDRTDLRDWLALGAKDDEGKAAWLAAHPQDPLSAHAEAQRRRKLGQKPAPAEAAAGAAALAAHAIKAAPPKPAPVGAASRSAASAASNVAAGRAVIGAIIAGITLMLFASYLARSTPVDGRLPAIANSLTTVTAATCPPGEAPAYLFNSDDILQHGDIIDDTAN